MLRKVNALEENKKWTKVITLFYAVICIYESYFANSLQNKNLSQTLHFRRTYIFREIPLFDLFIHLFDFLNGTHFGHNFLLYMYIFKQTVLVCSTHKSSLKQMKWKGVKDCMYHAICMSMIMLRRR